ncbi:threonylcarbamoyl-AMP synthase [Candidatus Parcubacteria bacterium]|nr:MAG: threonylcarbamoyl-AMP synthase [Candidatus Parcubacteria bacterium]
MEIIKIKKKIQKKYLSQIKKILRNDGVIVYPTDTAYALGGIYSSGKAINKILKIKNRQDRKFTLVASDLKQVRKFFELNLKEQKLAKQFWPGPLSIVVSKNYAVRVPNNEIAKKLCRLAGSPLIATSANISGQATIYSAKEAVKQFADKKNQPDLVVDFGRLKKIKSSTVVLIKNKEIIILRKGSVKF